jgi:hypothetical protein
MMDSMASSAAQPLVSVIMPVYNAAPYLQESIDSILQQTYSNFEFIIFNDGSTDASATIIAAAAVRDPRIIFVDGPNRGLVAQLNNGIEQAQGIYLARMDADDIAPAERLALQVAYLEANLEVGLCGGAVRMFGAGVDTLVQLPEDNNTIRYTLCWQNAFFHPAVTLRRSVLLTHGLRYREEYMTAEDYQLWCEMSRVTQLHNLPEVMLNYRIHPHQLTRVQSARGQRTTARIREEQMAQLGIVLTAEEREGFVLLNADRHHPHLRLAEYQQISRFIRQLYARFQGNQEAAAVAYKVLNSQWYEVLKAASHFRPHLLPLLTQHPLGGSQLSKVNLTLAVKYLVSWRPNLPTYLKRYWRRRLSL